MRLTVLGSGTSAPSRRRGSPACLVRAGDAVALIDSGPGALRQLARLELGPHDLGDLLYTHAHPDHTNDLWAFLFASRNPALGRRGRPLRLHGSPGFFDFYHRVRAAFGSWVEAQDYAIEEVVHQGQTVALGPALLRGFPVPHIASSIAYRIEAPGGRALVVSGDTDYGPGIVEAARGADLLLLECATADAGKLDGHLSPALCGRIAREAGVRRLVLTHFYPEADLADLRAELERAGCGDAALAEDFLELEI